MSPPDVLAARSGYTAPVDREAASALHDALEAVRRAEAMLNTLDRPALAKLAQVVQAVEHLAREHAAVMLDLRIARLRIQALLGPASEHDPDKTPVEGVRRLSEQLAAVRKP